MLSTRPDVVGPEMARELAHLQTATLADPSDTVRATIEAELGKVMVDNARVVKTDEAASNGVIHVIDTVLLPK